MPETGRASAGLTRIMLMVLNQAGLIKVVEPAALRKQVREVAQKILKAHA